MSELNFHLAGIKAVSPSVTEASKGLSNITSINTDTTHLNVKGAVASEQVSLRNMQESVSRIAEYVQQNERRLDFRLDEASGQTVISVYDKHSDELIRQIPGELALQLAQRLNDEEPLLLFSARV